MLFKKCGFDRETVQSLGLRGKRNSSLLVEATKLDRVIILFDADFKSVRQTSHPGIIFIDINPNTDKKVLPLLKG